jgi:hypothetical protein
MRHVVILFALLAGLAVGPSALALSPDQVLVIVNDASPEGLEIADYYAAKRGIPSENVFHLVTTTAEVTTKAAYASEIKAPVEDYITSAGLRDTIRAVVTTKGVPLKVQGDYSYSSPLYDWASVESELTLLFSPYEPTVPKTNPYYNAGVAFDRTDMYLAARLDAYTVDEAKAELRPNARRRFDALGPRRALRLGRHYRADHRGPGAGRGFGIRQPRHPFGIQRGLRHKRSQLHAGERGGLSHLGELQRMDVHGRQ